MSDTREENVVPENTKQTTLDEDLKHIRDAKYDHALESSVCNWIGQIIGRPKGANESAAAWLKSGDVLCILVNHIRPGTIPKYNANTKSKFKQMENITLFLRACRELGMLEKDLFSTVDLYEAKDMNTVILMLFNLGGTIQSTIPYFTGPKLGIKQTKAKFQVVPPLDCPPPVIAPPPVASLPAAVAAPVVVPPVAVVSSVPPVPASIGLPTMLVTPAPDLIYQSAAVEAPNHQSVEPSFTPDIIPSERKQQPQAKIPETPLVAQQSSSITTKNALPAMQQAETYAGKPSVVKPNLADFDIKPRKRQPLNSYKANQPPIQYQQQPIRSVATNPSSFYSTNFFPHINYHSGVFPGPLPIHPAATSSYQGYGSTLLKQVNAAAVNQYGLYHFPAAAEIVPVAPSLGGTKSTVVGPATSSARPISRKSIQRRQIMPQDGSFLALEQAVLDWMESILREKKQNQLPLFQWIQSGEVLCRLVNEVLGVSPNPNIRITDIASGVYLSRDHVVGNLSKFLNICKALGVRDADTFVPAELAEGMQNGYSSVLNCVFCLGGVLQNYEWWVVSNYPQLGRRIKIAT